MTSDSPSSKRATTGGKAGAKRGAAAGGKAGARAAATGSKPSAATGSKPSAAAGAKPGAQPRAPKANAAQPNASALPTVVEDVSPTAIPIAPPGTRVRDRSLNDPAAAINPGSTSAARDLADVSAVELVSTVSVHLLSAAALRCGLADEGEDLQDLSEARVIINALAGLITAAAPDLGDTHARALRDGLRSVQLAFREASVVPDAPGEGPGEKYTGAVR